MDIVEAKKRIDQWFPELARAGYEPKSEETIDYNCIAWAAGESHRRRDPSPGYYWPAGIPRNDRLQTLIQLFESLGFTLADNANDAPLGMERIALYGDEDSWTHAARQLPNGKWTSKLGDFEDIEHDSLDGFGAVYGEVKYVMKRKMR